MSAEHRLVKGNTQTRARAKFTVFSNTLASTNILPHTAHRHQHFLAKGNYPQVVHEHSHHHSIASTPFIQRTRCAAIPWNAKMKADFQLLAE